MQDVRSQPGRARTRVLEAALQLFAEHGVHATSLSAIAEHLGVSKAAVYHQFRTKDEIVLALLEPALARLEALVGAAEAAAPSERTGCLLAGLVDLVVDEAGLMRVIQDDPEVTRLLAEHPPMAAVTRRTAALLHGPAPTPARRVAASVVGRGLVSAPLDPLLADLAPDVLRQELLAVARALLD